MKLSEKLEQARGPFYTFEFFPPRTEQVSQINQNMIADLVDGDSYTGLQQPPSADFPLG